MVVECPSPFSNKITSLIPKIADSTAEAIPPGPPPIIAIL